MSRGTSDKRKTKAQLVKELNDLRDRLAELESERSAAADHAAEATPPVEQQNGDVEGHTSNGQLGGNGSTPSLGDLADTVMATLRRSVPEQVDVRLTVEERMGMIPTLPGIAEQIVVNLFLIRAEPTLPR